MALTREQTNALARHVIKASQANQQPQQMSKLDAELMEAYLRLDRPLSPIDPDR